MVLHSSALGKIGEERAVSVLEAAGMEIIAKNFKSKYGEIDIIALNGETVVFTEVKAWSAFGQEDLQYSLDNKKQQKIIKTAKYFMSINRKYSNMAIRFDVVFVRGNKASGRSCFTHLVSAFMEGV